MKKALLLAAALGLLGASSAAQAAPNNPLIVWPGSVTVTDRGGTCVHLPLSIGATGLSFYRPRLDPGEPASLLTMIFGTSAHAFSRTGGGVQMHGIGSVSVTFIHAGPFMSADRQFGFSAFTITPSTITATTTVVTIVGKIQGFSGNPTCIVWFEGVYTRLPKPKKTL